MDVKRVFNMDNLPVGFASLGDKGTIDRAATTNAISRLAEIVWKKGGFRFWHRGTNWEKREYLYFCSQDAQRARNSVSRGQHDTPQIERFSCHSRLVFRLSLDQRTCINQDISSESKIAAEPAYNATNLGCLETSSNDVL